MRFVVLGAGAIGGVLGGLLFEHGNTVVLIARGAHLQAIRTAGLRVETPDRTVTLPVPAVGDPAEVAFQPDDVIVVAVKSQDTAAALHTLALVAPPSTPIVCAQNGVENERIALRFFANVYGLCVMCPATHLEAGVVQAHSTPTTGILDVGRYPRGLDDVAEALASAFRSSTFASEAIGDVSRWKYTKLLTNLGNAVEAVCGPPARSGAIGRRAKEEGVACLEAAGIDFASDEEDAARRGRLLTLRPIAGQARAGGSSWQSLARSVGSIETGYLNGEVVLLGRQYGVPTPVNAALQRHAQHLARYRMPPGSISEETFWRQLEAGDR